MIRRLLLAAAAAFPLPACGPGPATAAVRAATTARHHSARRLLRRHRVPARAPEARAGHAEAAASPSTSSRDMEGLAAAVRNVTEMRPVDRGGIAAARAVPPGADGRGERGYRRRARRGRDAVHRQRRATAAPSSGTSLVDQLDPEAILIRGYPKPIVMSTGLNPKVDAIMIVGAHANAGSPGVISHSFAFDSFTVNGKALNEAGIAAFIGGEMGVPMILAAGDDVLTAETREMLGPIETVTVKTVFSRSAAAVLSPAEVHRQLREAAARAVRRAKARTDTPLLPRETVPGALLSPPLRSRRMTGCARRSGGSTGSSRMAAAAASPTPRSPPRRWGTC